MPVSMSHKAAFLTIWALFCAILAAGCGSGEKSQKSGFQPAKNNGTVLAEDSAGASGRSTGSPGSIDDPAWQDDYSDLTRRGSRSDRPGHGGGAESADPRTARAAFWTIVLRTYGSDADELMIRNTHERLRQSVPELARMDLHVTSKGSMFIYGRYDGPEDPRAQQDLARMKALTINNRQPFRTAMLSRVRNPQAAMHPHHLMAARRANPKIDPLYTLDVAMWSDFDTGRLTLREIRQAAERYCAELRAQNLPAFFHHDESARMSIVTVGLFSSKDIDPQSGLESPELTALRKRFPARLTNGEEVYELINPRVSDKRRLQGPKLVLVPMQ